MAEHKALPASELCRKYDLSMLGFTDTTQIEDLREPLGQDRAVEAIRFGIGVRHEGFNLFAFGSSGAGKTETILRYLEPEAAAKCCPDDWCYVNNFAAPDHPKMLRLPAGRARELAKQMESLAEEVRVVISRRLIIPKCCACPQAARVNWPNRWKALPRKSGSSFPPPMRARITAPGLT